ncbi:odorant receptor 131-2-like [Notolabrus celidotus]|uniref:odorant receptor 131-2-like n=1 Tax=Notolabrus celidotus TaxID=1203425 RepID=UPI0014903670|nr:odorant receptor 131-2-like [Notolabrus celidotus]
MPWLERVILATSISLNFCTLFVINVIMLFVLRSKPVFRETCRYILLFNLLSADTLQMAVCQILYILSTCRIMLLYPVCGILVMFTYLTTEISPLTLVVMSLERYVAVCHPLRHAAVVNIRNTGVAIFTVWALGLLNILTRVIFLSSFPFEDLESLQMKQICNALFLFLVPISYDYDKVYSCLLFVSSAVVITSSYIGVVIAARSASTDKASAQKARDTVLLHLLQLAFSLLSTLHNSVIVSLSQLVSRLAFVRIMNVLFVFIIILPRCLSALIYGFRDQTIKPIFFKHLGCQFKLLSRKN